MKFVILFHSLVSAILFSDFEDTVRQNYKSDLLHVITILKKGDRPKIRLLKCSVPSTKEEAQIFFHLDYDSATSKEYQRLFEIIVAECSNGNKELLKRYIPLSEFVDGYFAEDFFDSIVKIQKSARSKYCQIYKQVAVSRKERLKEISKSCN
jgi:hypothetical protein